jgi:hypothetical protein
MLTRQTPATAAARFTLLSQVPTVKKRQGQALDALTTHDDQTLFFLFFSWFLVVPARRPGHQLRPSDFWRLPATHFSSPASRISAHHPTGALQPARRWMPLRTSAREQALPAILPFFLALFLSLL